MQELLSPTCYSSAWLHRVSLDVYPSTRNAKEEEEGWDGHFVPLAWRSQVAEWQKISCTRQSTNILFTENTASCGPKLCTIFCIFYIYFTANVVFHQKSILLSVQRKSKCDNRHCTSPAPVLGPQTLIWVPQHCWILSS